MKLGGREDASRRGKRIQNSPVTHKPRVVRLSKELKPEPAVKAFPETTEGLSGVKGNSAHRRRVWEHERSNLAAGAGDPQSCEGINNRARSLGWKSEGFIVAKKRVMTVERRGPDAEDADSEAREGRLV
jgi:hypothetical protein